MYNLFIHCYVNFYFNLILFYFRMRSKIVTIGIAPWGLLRRREKLIGCVAHIPYDRHSFLSRSRYAVLNDRHSYFLLVDNGTVGRFLHLLIYII